MFIEKHNNNGTYYLRLKKSHYNKIKKKQDTTVVLNLGPLSRFDDGEPNYVERLRKSFKEGKPLIKELIPFVDEAGNENLNMITLNFQQGTSDCVGEPKIFSSIILNHLFKELGLTQFFTTHKSRSKIEYDLLGMVKLMCYGRILNPASKMSTFSQKNDYYDNICKSDNPYSMYRVLDILHEKRSNILQRINSEITRTIGRNTDLVFYDVTNFYFETEYADEEEIVDGELVKGLRQKGVSKENKKSPIVQMGLFMDSNGIPISFEAFAGNALDQTTLRPAMKKTVDNFELSRFILVSDRGMMSGPNIAHVTKAGNGYLISKSIKKTAKNERKWIIEQEGYISKSADFKYKSRIVERTITDEDGIKHKIKQKVIVYWSRKFYEKERKEHQSFLEFVEEFQKNPHNFRVSKTQSGYLKKFMKKEFMNKMTGELIHGNELMGFIDEEKLSKNTEYYGYYQLVTSELEMTEEEAIEKYHGLSQIENQFRIMKSTLETRPMYVKKRSHIHAHLTVCLIALIMMRVLQFMIRKHPTIKLDEKLTWHEGMSAHRVQNALNKLQVEELAQGFYRFNNLDDNDVQLLVDSFGLDIEKKLYSAGDLRKMIKNLWAIE